MPQAPHITEGPELPLNWEWREGDREEQGHVVWASGPNGHPDAWIKDGEMVFEYYNGGRAVPMDVIVAMMRRAGFVVERADYPTRTKRSAEGTQSSQPRRDHGRV